MQGIDRALAAALSLIGVIAVTVALAQPALAHEGEEVVPAVTDVQEAIAILATHPSFASQASVLEHATDKVNDALKSNDARGVSLSLLSKAQAALESGQLDQALTLLEQSIGACPGAPVINPANAPRTPPPLASPCPSPAAHLLALPRSPIGGTKEPVLIAVGAVLILAGLGLARKIR
jgi:hypothetical protein